MPRSITIDGPAGAGKSTVAKALAARLGSVYLDTGAMYRALTWKALRAGVSAEDEDGLSRLLDESRIDLTAMGTVHLDDQDVTLELRSRVVDDNVSRVAHHPKVRTRMVRLQRALADRRDVVMDGRDAGTEILPNADLKVFLTASLEERACRRYRELQARGEDVSLDVVRRALAQRDESDSTRAMGALKSAPDAVWVDSTGMSADDVVARLLELVRRP